MKMRTNLDNKNIPSNKKFGLTFSIIFLLISLWLWIEGKNQLYVLCFFVVGMTFLVLALLRPHLLSRLNLLWYEFGVSLSKITNPIIMFIVYFIFFAPIKLLYYLSKKNKTRCSENSTWASRDKDVGSMKNQF
ncbi:MAG: hypothetical protein VYB18_01030 [Thermodesulfobacteriota bacterium]|nr:hypothetical protein [Thermodesulfobacteriota bacterium]